MPNKKLKCFIAMAFGKEDCDKLYDNQIIPVLKSLEIIPIRVDRREHKDDLNVYIIKMLEESDLVIADLTYTRPSVYYEAGYGEAKKPIAYTVRKDHLNRSQPEDLRVHFDLQMKKIIHWSNPEDPTFFTRFESRIRYLIAPLLKQREKDDSDLREIAEFDSLSVYAKSQKIFKIFSDQLETKNFWVKPYSHFNNVAAERLDPVTIVIGVKKSGKKFILCVITIGESITKKQMETIVNTIKYSNLLKSDNWKLFSEYEENYFFCSFRKIPTSRITTSFPSATPLKDNTIFSYFKRIKEYRPEKEKIEKITIYNISPLRSEREIREKATEYLQQYSPKISKEKPELFRDEFNYTVEITFK